MKLKVIPIGVIRMYCNEQEINVLQHFTSRELIKLLGLPDKLIITPFVTGVKIDLDDSLEDGDEVKFVTMVMGG